MDELGENFAHKGDYFASEHRCLAADPCIATRFGPFPQLRIQPLQYLARRRS